MKYETVERNIRGRMVAPPHRGAWIEIDEQTPFLLHYYCRPPAQGAWIEMDCPAHRSPALRVAPSIGA